MEISKNCEKRIRETETATQEEWLEHFSKSKTHRMIEARDILEIDDIEIVKSLRKDCNESWLITATQIDYKKNEWISEYTNTPISQVDEKFLNLIFGKMPKEKIIQRLEIFSGKSKEDIRIWTRDKSIRNTYPLGAVVFGDGGGRFHVVGYGHFVVSCGCSRGVKK